MLKKKGMSQSKEFYQFYSVLFSVRQIYLIIDNMGFASQGGSHCTTVWGKNETKINLHSVVFNVVVVRCHEHHVYLEGTSFFLIVFRTRLVSDVFIVIQNI